MNYLVVYQLNQRGQNYTSLRRVLRQFRAVKIQQSVYLIDRDDADARSLWNRLWREMDDNDQLIVVCLDDGDWWGDNKATDLIEDD